MSFYFREHNWSSTIEIKNNPNCKIENLSIEGYGVDNIEFYLNFENLVKFEIRLYIIIDNVKNAFQFFSENCNITFKRLNYFCFINKKNNDTSVLINLYKNLT